MTKGNAELLGDAFQMTSPRVTQTDNGEAGSMTNVSAVDGIELPGVGTREGGGGFVGCHDLAEEGWWKDAMVTIKRRLGN